MRAASPASLHRASISIANSRRGQALATAREPPPQITSVPESVCTPEEPTAQAGPRSRNCLVRSRCIRESSWRHVIGHMTQFAARSAKASRLESQRARSLAHTPNSDRRARKECGRSLAGSWGSSRLEIALKKIWRRPHRHAAKTS